MLRDITPTAAESKVLSALSMNGLSEEPLEVVKYNDEPKIPTYACLPNERAREKYLCNEAYGQGSALNTTVAKIKATAEFLERLAISNPQKRDISIKAYEPDLCANPNMFLHYSNAQINLHGQRYRGSKNDVYRWVNAVNHLTGSKILVPAQLVYISKLFSSEPEIAPEQITTGAALGGSIKKTFESGFLEVVERDAFMLSYLTKRKLTKVNHFPGSIDNMINYLKRYYLDVFVFDITTDLQIPVFMTIVVDKRGFGPGISVGLKSGFDIEHVIFGSIMEAIQPRRQARFNKDTTTNFKFPKEQEVDSMQARYFYWYPTGMIKNLNFMLKCKKIVNFNNLSNYVSSVEEGVRQLKDREYHIFYVDMTLNEIKKAGFVAGKVLIPELQPLYLDERSQVLYSVHGGSIKPIKGLKPHPFA